MQALSIVGAVALGLIFPKTAVDTSFTCVGHYGGSSCVAIDPHWVISAQHLNGSSVCFDGTKWLAVDQNIPNSFCDLRLLHVTATLPYYTRIYSGDISGQMVAIVGFGQTGTYDPTTDKWTYYAMDGNRYVAYNTAWGPSMWYFWGVTTTDGRLPNNGGILSGDSGGGWFVDLGNGPMLAAISSGNSIKKTDTMCGSSGMGMDLSQATIMAWVQSYVPDAYTAGP